MNVDELVASLMEKYSTPSTFGNTPWINAERAIREAILETRKAQWIPVSERLPEWEGRYLIQYRQHGQVRLFVADYYPTEGWASRMADMEILQWSEIPEPPQLADTSAVEGK